MKMPPKMKPILFSTPMVQAILAGNQTQTRRIIRDVPDCAEFIDLCDCMAITATDRNGSEYPKDVDGLYATFSVDAYPEFPVYKSRYQIGDILWVRETWCKYFPASEPPHLPYLYRASHPNAEIVCGNGCWKPSIHMPRAAARIFLRVTDVRLERVQDISEDDAIAEGCKGVPCDHSTGRYACEDCMNSGWRWPPQFEFMELWEQINAKRGYGWDENPWVWAYSFEQITKEEA